MYNLLGFCLLLQGQKESGMVRSGIVSLGNLRRFQNGIRLCSQSAPNCCNLLCIPSLPWLPSLLNLGKVATQICDKLLGIGFDLSIAADSTPGGLHLSWVSICPLLD